MSGKDETSQRLDILLERMLSHDKEQEPKHEKPQDDLRWEEYKNMERNANDDVDFARRGDEFRRREELRRHM